ncbi:P-loop containing nucleoside triphosphate hydrolase protein, partial [Xylaria flabelliformis]
MGAFAPASSRSRWSQNRCFSASALRYAAAKYPKVAALLIPEFRTSAITEITPDDLFKSSSLASAPGQPLEDELTKLYTRNPAAFVYAESDFYKLRKNTRVPEVCILGRSNVGKSSFLNALANRSSNGLAHVSSKAGKTRSINTYGFGPAPTIKQLQDQGSERKDEDIPTHTFHLVDMPGYGHASLKEWGKNIALYLKKRNFVKGAIVLIDAEVGPKDSDFHLLQLLSDAQLKTAIVMTKADKVRKGLEGLRETCTKVWDGIRAIEAQSTDGNWVWEKDVYVTAVGAKDSAVARSTLTTARLAVARLAGLVKDERLNVERNKRWSGKMISFDDLQYAS